MLQCGCAGHNLHRILDLCTFCEIIAGRKPASVVHEDDNFMAFMDIFPWRPGHVLVIAKTHCQYVHELAMPIRKELFALGTRVAEAIRASDIECDDVHFLINDGRAANQTVPHVHLHILPRRRGDLWQLVATLATRPLIWRIGRTLHPTRWFSSTTKPSAGIPSRAELDRHAALIRGHFTE
ncbi:MAG: HIT domain-containing protein [Proteobacteria bacterium]|nr:HIT domain-containing protein [Pseudomonadota bacterium]